jgi:zinc transport system substrate-binding protein
MKAMSRRRFGRWCTLVVAAAVTTGCSYGHTSAALPARHRLKVVAALYPLAEVARLVGGSRVAITDLTPAGIEPHGLTLRADQVATIRDAGTVIDIGRGFQSGVEQVAASGHNTVSVLPAIGGADPHIWLDPIAMQQVVAMVARAFERADPAGTAEYDRGTRDFDAALGALDISYRTSLADCARHDIVTSHQAFGRLAARYGLVQDAIGGLSPGPRPDPRRLAQLADLAKRKGITTVFTEPLVSDTAAQTLAREAHLKTAVLDPIEGLTPATENGHTTYLSLMADNLDRLRSALACSNSES